MLKYSLPSDIPGIVNNVRILYLSQYVRLKIDNIQNGTSTYSTPVFRILYLCYYFIYTV